ncbi:MAG: sulfotransferase [Thermomicrobiales bacterium]|nr:sulfotransferase [Thermomicrobiales bacterium]
MAAIEGLTVSPMGRRVQVVLAAGIDRPVKGGTSDTYDLTIEGWAIGKEAPVEAVEAVSGGRVLQTVPVDRPTPRLEERFAAAGPGAAVAGFTMTLNTLTVEPEFDIRLRAIIGGEPLARIAAIKGRRKAIEPGYAPRLQPLMVTSLGRTGTTLLMTLLAAHPAIVAYRRYPYEARAAKYWLHLLKTLARPVDPTKRIGRPNEFHVEEQVVAGNPFASPAFGAYPEAAIWAGTGYLDRLAGFCMESIDGWYERVAHAQEQEAPVFYVEKGFPDDYAGLTRSLYPQGREIVLVRDFRDMWASMRSFNERRGFGDFGQARAVSDQAWLDELRIGVHQLLEIVQRNSERALVVRYEQLVTDPERVLGALLAALGLTADPATIAAMGAGAGAALEEHRTSANPAASIGRWRRDLNEERQEVARAAFDDLLTAFGYDPEA